MFKLIAGLFLVTNGTIADAPVHIMTYNHSVFETEELCREFLETDIGRAATAAIALSARGQGIAVRFACEHAEDNTL